jgi:hypothetical protein
MEHRTTFRRPTSIPATLFNARHGFARATLHDLSFDGAWFDVDDTFAVRVNSRVGVVIVLPGARQPVLRFDAFVVRRGKGGIAVMFSGDGPEVGVSVDRIFEHCRQTGNARFVEQNPSDPVVQVLHRHTG